MAQYTPEFMASLKHDVEDTDIPLEAIATKHGISKRTVHRMIDRGRWQGRNDRVRELPPAARLLGEATGLLTAKGGRKPEPPIPNPSASSTPADMSSAIERLTRLVEQELTAEEAVRAQLGPLPRNLADAERTARTLSTLTQTLHALQRLRGGLGTDAHDDDDIPRDIDEFRLELARRIEAFVASRLDLADAGSDSGTVVEEPRA